MHISKKIIKEFGGEVEVKSIVNVGSEFIFSFMLEKRSFHDEVQVKRVLNPSTKKYQKIFLQNNIDKDSENEEIIPQRALPAKNDDGSSDGTVDFEMHYSDKRIKDSSSKTLSKSLVIAQF